MKTVATTDELRRLALAQGATVDVGGQRFNAGASRLQAAKPKPAEPAAPMPTPAPPPPAIDTEPIARAITALSAAQYEGSQRLMERIAELLRPQVSAPAPSRARMYTFQITRDGNGLIDRVTAAPIEDTAR